MIQPFEMKETRPMALRDGVVSTTMAYLLPLERLNHEAARRVRLDKSHGRVWQPQAAAPRNAFIMFPRRITRDPADIEPQAEAITDKRMLGIAPPSN